MITKHSLKTLIAALALLGSACSSDGGGSTGTGGSRSGTGGTSGVGGATASGGGSGGLAGSGGTVGSGGSGTGGRVATGGAIGSGGRALTGGTSGTAGAGGAAGNPGNGAATGTGGQGLGTGGAAVGGTTGAAGMGSGGRVGTGGIVASGGATGSGGAGLPDGGNKDLAGSETGAGGGTGTFDPCPASGACNILPLGDSITWGVNYDGGYRVKLFSNSITDKKNVTYVGKLSNGPATVSGTTFPKNNEGHSGWTIQQIDDIVTGTSTDANYKGKKMMVDLAPNIVLLHAGTNDTSRSPSGMPDRLGALIDHILADGPNVLLVVTTIIPIKQGSYGTVGETFNNAIPALVQKRIDAGKHVVLVDMFKSFPSNGLSSDGVHPNQQGYDWMAGVWYEAIKAYLH